MNISKFLVSNKKPLVLINRETKERVQSGMGFILKNFSSSYKVVVSAKHNFLVFPYQEFDFRLGISNKKLEIVGKPIFPEKLDLVFFLVKDSKKILNTTFSKIGNIDNLRDGSNLINVRNSFHPDYSYKRVFPFEATIQKISLTNEFQVINESTTEHIKTIHKDNFTLVEKYKSEGFTLYETIKMQCRKGYSGCPIFDRSMKLYGMHIRGNGDGTVSCFVNAEIIKDEYSKVEENLKSYI